MIFWTLLGKLFALLMVIGFIGSFYEKVEQWLDYHGWSFEDFADWFKKQIERFRH